jgi:ABC-type transport system involved in cytochrome bd biosynthesis fused ATPase/permease subunit
MVRLFIGSFMQAKTCIMIAHRLSSIRDSDRILVLEKGRIVGFDEHFTLVKTCPTYISLLSTIRINEYIETKEESKGNRFNEHVRNGDWEEGEADERASLLY